jgi:translocation and assembly module TamA
MRTYLLGAVAAAALLVAALPAMAQQVRLRIAAEEEVVDAVRANSLVISEIVRAREEDRVADRRDIIASAQADYTRIVGTLFEQGYYGPVVSIRVDGREVADLATVGDDSPVREVVIAVEAGPAFLFGRTEAGPLAPGTEIPEGFARGARAETQVLRNTVSAGVDAWRARGHAFAELGRQDLIADYQTRRLDAQLVFAPGPRLTYGPITVSGNRRVRGKQIERIAELQPGRTYDPQEIADAAERLNRTGAFRSVAIVEADEPGPGDTLPLAIQVVEQLPRRLGAGAEISTTDGLSLSAFWLHRNLTGFADALRFETSITGVGGNAGDPDYTIGLTYNRPATFNSETDLFVNGEIAYEDRPGYRARTGSLEVGASRIVSDRYNYSYGIGYRYSDVTDAFGRRTFQVLSLPLEAEYDRRDDSLNPADGYYILAEARPFTGIEGTDSGARVFADLRGYEGFDVGEFEDRVVAAARIQLGSVVGPILRDVPPDYLFFSGGGGTVRGQEFESLGEILPSGRLVGGKSFLGLSAEMRVGVTETIGVVGFADYGLVSPESDWSDFDDHAGVGLGARYNTGIGPIRLDVAVPVGGPGDPSGVEFYLGIGQAF